MIELTQLAVLLTIICCTHGQSLQQQYFDAVGNVTVEGSVVGTFSSAIMDAKRCGALCLKNRNCSVYSITPSTGLGAETECILGKNKLILIADQNSQAYFVSSKGTTAAYVHVKYTRTVTSLDEARGYCISTANGSLPIPYPRSDDLAWAKSFAGAAGDHFYIDMTIIGDFGGKELFITGRGDVVNAGDANKDPRQFWQAGQPDYTAPGAFVIMTQTGWKTVPPSTSVSYVVCSREHSPYRLNTDNGKYYKFVQNPVLNNPQATTICARDGGKLALPFATKNGSGAGPVQIRAGGRVLCICYWVAGTDAAQDGLWRFTDGTALSVNPSDGRQLWASGQPDGGALENCLYVSIAGIGYWGDISCTNPLCPYICELPGRL